ncbi:MAG: hypothetical protein HQK89_11315, partial [Nitrospirae bacterium]|nr:hypothetical protein [Nitrospirota bacterium]
GKEKGATEGKREGFQEGELKGLQEGERKGLLKGIQLTLDIKFGGGQGAVFDQISGIDDVNRLEQIAEFIRKSATIDDLRKLIG